MRESKEKDAFCFRRDSFTCEYQSLEKFEGEPSLTAETICREQQSSIICRGQQTSIDRIRSKQGKHCARKSRYKEEKRLIITLKCGQEDEINTKAHSLIFLPFSALPCPLPIFLFFVYHPQACLSYYQAHRLYL